MSNKFVQSMDEINSANWTRTENYAPALSSTGNALLDLFGVIGSLRTRPHEVVPLFAGAFAEDELMALRMSFYARDVRGGLGERDVPRLIWSWLANSKPVALLPNIALIPFFGRWDDLYCLVGTRLEADMWELIQEQWVEDQKNYHAHAGKSISLMAKWLKSTNTSSKDSRRLGRMTASALGMKESQYRHALALLRERIGIVESKMSKRQWNEIDYETVPSRAMMILRKAFGRHDPDGFAQYIAEVQSGKKVIHSSTLFPYDILESAGLEHNGRNYFRLTTPDTVLEEQWKNLPLYVEGGKNVIVIGDTSASMTREVKGGRPICTSIGLSIYFAQRNAGVFHNRFITFSGSPSWIVLQDGDSLAQAVKRIPSIVDNTNLEAAFQMVLDVAVENNIPAEDMPVALVVISDMEIDDYSATGGCTPSTFHKTMKRRFEDSGYKMPSIVYWNVDSRQNVFHASASEPNTMLASGQSPSVFRDILNAIGTTPFEAMVRILNSDRYACIS